jgi:hypothetical protein
MAASGWTAEDREYYRRVIVPEVQEDRRRIRRERWTAGAVLLAVGGVLIALITLYDGLSWLGDGSGWTSNRWLGGDGVWQSDVRLLILITLTVIVVRRWPEAWRDRFNAIVTITLISGFLALMLADGMLQRFHHPVKLPAIGWIGDPKPPADPGDYDHGY